MTVSVSPAEMIIWLLARELRSDDVMVVGTGTPIASLSALYARELHAPGLTLLSDALVNPVTHDVSRPMVKGDALNGAGDGYYTMLEALEYCARSVATVLLMRPAQVDSYANVNVSLIGTIDKPKRVFPGSLAVGDMPVVLDRILLYEPNHSRQAFVDRVDFITGVGTPSPGWRRDEGVRGQGATCIVSNLCVMRFQPEGGWALESLHPGVELDAVVDSTGFALKVPDSVPQSTVPHGAALKLLREVLDPHRVRDIEFRELREAVVKDLYALA